MMELVSWNREPVPTQNLTAPGRYSTCVLCYTCYIILDIVMCFDLSVFTAVSSAV